MGNGVEAAWPSTRRHVGGVTLHAVETGPADGPLVILLHGFPESWWGWRRQIGPLAARGFRVVAPDGRGYNLSDKPEGVAAYRLDALAADVVGLADACGRASFLLVGHDWGGVVAWWTAARHPERVERLAILNAPHPDVFGRYLRRRPAQALKSWYAGFFQAPRLPEALLRVGDFALLRRAMTRTARSDAFEPGDLDVYARAWKQPGALTAMLNYYRALPRRPGGPPSRVRPPTLVIWGARDAFLERGVAEASLELCDDGRALFLDEATHWVHLEEAEAVNGAISDFFRTA